MLICRKNHAVVDLRSFRSADAAVANDALLGATFWTTTSLALGLLGRGGPVEARITGALS